MITGYNLFHAATSASQMYGNFGGRTFNSSMNPRVEDEDSERMVLPQKIETGLSVGLKSWMIFHSEAILEIMASVVELFVSLCSSGS